jgi:DNA-binding transcriptional LysR family regulator
MSMAAYALQEVDMTQPPLSRQIRLLEHQVGTTLLERNSRGVRLTTAGNAFLPKAARILRVAEDATFIARRAAKGEQWRRNCTSAELQGAST